MTKRYRVTSPDGHTYDVEAPDDASQDDVMKQVQQQHAQPPQDDEPSTLGTFSAGVAQGAVLDPIEGLGQLAEHVPYLGAIPRFIGNSPLGQLADQFRNYAQSTSAGEVGELGGAVGSMIFDPFLGLGGLAGRALSTAGRAGQRMRAAEAGLQGVRSAVRAGPEGYAGVTRGLEPYLRPGAVAKRATEGELGIKVAPASQDTRTLGKYLPEADRPRPAPSKARAAFETPNPPNPPIGPPTRGERFRLAAGDAARSAATRVKVLAHRHPVAAGAVRGAAAAGLQPVVGGRDYWSEKEQQLAAGAALGVGAASPLVRRAATALATHAGLHGAGAAAFPTHWGLHWPLHHLARRATHAMAGPGGKPWKPSTQRALGAAAGQAQHEPERLPIHRDPKFRENQ